MRPSEKIYAKYEFLAKKYANKLYSYEDLSFEYEDLVQEFRIKIYTSIKAYGRRWLKYRRGEAARPVPIRYYLEAACGNKERDFIKYISRESGKVRIDDINYDFGTEDNYCTIDSAANKFTINDIDLLEGLEGKNKAIFSLFLRGYTKTKIAKVINNKNNDDKVDVNSVIETQRNYLITKYGSELLQQRKMYSTYSLDED